MSTKRIQLFHPSEAPDGITLDLTCTEYSNKLVCSITDCTATGFGTVVYVPAATSSDGGGIAYERTIDSHSKASARVLLGRRDQPSIPPAAVRAATAARSKRDVIVCVGLQSSFIQHAHILRAAADELARMMQHCCGTC